ncbi:MAG: TIGR00701 family protein [Alphaproteobacteria bacterium RIFCSPLOWO2_01_FULL_40_26]|nr:MAG: TIGR00701 family protein [Alphaproteobacteria bacterium RIFCSPHIGHO2_02_FULL_40_34]OFW94074.1 MAG: TIGR00701 family protein [Alphaproteobacteria bacterium RIFCSPLOWO2_01_FULL_40_26]OFX09594.1 MAG: TIGR00701 family protein [Alphaproteobacteria bacterium RIFCSPLOWO2_02_FULL_40_19]OFX11255.1 MAG: TIGR00701 family protein [Alphaproteobacteria bacterium RIFCSPLOWO2_12_FULL_40_11]
MAEIELYDVIKILHIAAVISWLAGLLYLPRIFVYHAQVTVNSESDKIFQTMERRLLRYIMNPAMILVFIFGFYLAWQIGFEFVWLHVKLTLVAILVFYHHLLSRWRRDFQKGQNKHSQKFYRIINELPTILMIAIIALVVLKPF